MMLFGAIYGHELILAVGGERLAVGSLRIP
jgi:hypothetical protein